MIKQKEIRNIYFNKPLQKYDYNFFIMQIKLFDILLNNSIKCIMSTKVRNWFKTMPFRPLS